MSTRILIALVCLVSLAAGNALACQTYHVPGDAPNLPAAIAMAQPGDIIELAMGRHKIVGREHALKADLTIRCTGGLPGACVLEEVGSYPGDWRDHPVFILDDPGAPCRFENLTFRGWNLADGPYQFISNPILHVVSGRVSFQSCQWQDFYKQAMYFSGGRGEFRDCEFSYGRGCPSAISFGGDELVLDGCRFHHNSWIMDCDALQGSILQLCTGETRLTDCQFLDNGPLVHVLTIERHATLVGSQSCWSANTSVWEARLAGTAYLDCCELCVNLWHVVEGGELVLIDPPTLAKAMSREAVSWSGVKSLFD